MTTKQPHCLECNQPYTPRAKQQRFCSQACSKTFNNRRMTRGAELYDYFMSVRYLRHTHSGMLAVMSQMASKWRDDDEAERDGRFSWVPPDPTADPRAFDISRRKRQNRADAA